MKLRLVLPILFLLLAGDARAQVTTQPGGPGANLCAPRLITYATTTQGSISQPGGVGCYRLDGVAGERVRLRAASISAGFAPSVTIARPDGGVLCSGTRPTCVLPVSGRYSITVSGTGTGQFELSAQRVSNPIGCAPLNLGNPPSPTTLVAGGQPCYRVTGEAGMRLRLRLVRLSGANDLVAEVLRPDGTTRCGETSLDDSTCVLGTGQHTIMVFDRAPVVSAGSYALEARRLDGPSGCRSLTFGTLADSDWIGGGASDCYRVAVAAGDRLRVRVRADGLSPTLQPLWEVVRPNGTTLCSALPEEHTCTVDTAGTHAIVVRDNYPGARSGAYQVAVQRLNDPVGCTPGWLSTDATRAEITVGQTHCLRLVAFAGDRLRPRVIAGSPVQDMAVEVIRPDGSTRCDRHMEDCVLDVSGEHHILVRDRGRAGFGIYWWSVQRLNAPAGCLTLTRGAEPVVSPLALGATPCWRFQAGADENVRLVLTKHSGDFEPYREVLRPSGKWLSRASTTGTVIDAATWLLDTGWHTVLVRDGGRGLDTGVYDLALR